MSARAHSLVALGVLALVVAASAFATNGDERSRASVAVSPTAKFHDVEAAVAAGYGEFRDAAGIACIQHASEGTMGVHYVNGELVGDTVVDATKPEALVYEPEANGNLKLVALEWIVFKDAWDREHAAKPSLFGRAFDTTLVPNRYGIPAFYSLHAWLWKPNSTGLLEPWNPHAHC